MAVAVLVGKVARRVLVAKVEQVAKAVRRVPMVVRVLAVPMAVAEQVDLRVPMVRRVLRAVVEKVEQVVPMVRRVLRELVEKMEPLRWELVSGII